MTASIRLRNAAPAEGSGLFYAIRSARAWWYSAWLRTLARFSRTYLGSFWLGLSNLLSVAVLGLVYGTVFNVKDPIAYVIFIGFGITIWGMISQAATAGSTLFTSRREQLVNHAPATFILLPGGMGLSGTDLRSGTGDHPCGRHAAAAAATHTTHVNYSRANQRLAALAQPGSLLPVDDHSDGHPGGALQGLLPAGADRSTTSLPHFRAPRKITFPEDSGSRRA